MRMAPHSPRALFNLIVVAHYLIRRVYGHFIFISAHFQSLEAIDPFFPKIISRERPRRDIDTAFNSLAGISFYFNARDKKNRTRLKPFVTFTSDAI